MGLTVVIGQIELTSGLAKMQTKKIRSLRLHVATAIKGLSTRSHTSKGLN